jgi:hypothetical protein
MTITGAAYQGELVSGRFTGDKLILVGSGLLGRANVERGRYTEKFFIMVYQF